MTKTRFPDQPLKGITGRLYLCGNSKPFVLAGLVEFTVILWNMLLRKTSTEKGYFLVAKFRQK